MSTSEYVIRKQRAAKELFVAGANCAQAVLCAFQEETGLEQELLMKMASGFGGGMARMREVCGAVSGMFMAFDLLKGSASFTDKDAKDAQYAFLQRLAGEFKAETGSIICRELLGLESKGPDAPVSTPRTPSFYKKRPCAEMVALAAGILASALEK